MLGRFVTLSYGYSDISNPTHELCVEHEFYDEF